MNGQCVTTQDGYFYVSAICLALGVFILVVYTIPTAKRLQGETRSSPPNFDGSLTNTFSITCDQMAGVFCVVIYVAQQLSYNSSAIWKSRMPALSIFTHVIGLGWVPAGSMRAFLRKPEGCTTFSDTTTTILANSSLAQTHFSIKWQPQPCTLVRNGCASNPHQPRVLYKRISTPEAQPRSRA